jgi:hypothetical protein
MAMVKAEAKWTMISVEDRLLEAARTLAAVHVPDYSTGMRSWWPEIIRSHAESYNLQPPAQRPAAPDAEAISRMNEALGWFNYIPVERIVLRRVVAMLVLNHPITLRRKHSTRRVGQHFNVSHTTVIAWHKEGLLFIVEALNKNRTFQTFQNPRVSAPR